MSEVRRTRFPRRDWWWAHVGRLSGGLLALAFLAFLALLAAAGFAAAKFLLVLVAIGVAMIVLGGRLRGT